MTSRGDYYTLPREAHTLTSMYATQPVALRPLVPSGHGNPSIARMEWSFG